MKDLGEKEITLGDKKYTLKPTFRALAIIEERTGVTLPRLLSILSADAVGIHHVTGVIYGGICGYHDNETTVKYEDIGQEIIAHGMSKLTSVCALFVGVAYSGMSVSELEAKAKERDDELKKKREALANKKTA